MNSKINVNVTYLQKQTERHIRHNTGMPRLWVYLYLYPSSLIEFEVNPVQNLLWQLTYVSFDEGRYSE